MDDDLIAINGVDAASGAYLIPPLEPEQVVKLAKGEAIDPGDLSDLKAKLHRETEQHLGPVEGVDPNDLSEAGWGVVFAHNADPAIREALRELLDLRKGQAGRVKAHFYREFTADKGYRAGDPNVTKENKKKFLARSGAANGQPADPDKVPYYLLLVGDPETIPYRFQYQLDVEYAIGRLWFEKDGKPDLEAFARYARSVVEAESGRVPLARKAAFVGVANPDDRATRLSAGDLVEPLAKKLAPECPGWSIDTFLRERATKAQVARLLGGDETPTFLFTASHGIGFPSGDSRQLPHQGALLCQDWPGPLRWRQPIGTDFYFSGDDVASDARLLGLIAFHFACYGGGTPALDDFGHLRNAPSRDQIAPHPFVARLPQRLLSSAKGGALAVIGHVERAWGCSFYGGGRLGRQLQTFQSTVTRLLGGQRVGWALEYFNQLYAALAADLSEELENIEYGKQPDNLELSEMWTANNDARSFVVIGDPAVRLELATDGKPAVARPAVAMSHLRVEPPAAGPPLAAPAAQAAPAAAPEPPPWVPVAHAAPAAVPDTATPTASFDQQIKGAEERYQRREPTRTSFAAGSIADRVLQRNDPDRIRRRLARLGLGPEEIQAFLSGGMTSFAIIATAAPRDPRAASVAIQLERILGRNDMVESRFLEAGARAARPVGRVQIRSESGRAAGFGTGSLIAPRLLLTNNHVLESHASARASVVEFNVEDGLDGLPLSPETFALTPDEFFLTDVALDFTLVAVAARGGAGTELAAFGWNPARETEDAVLVEEFVNIVQHPSGQPKQVALRDNQVVDLLEDFLHYRTDTEPGSSGAPVFNDQWELIGLHHSGVPNRDQKCQILARGGGVWTPSMGENAVDWIANEGVRLSRILRFLKDTTMNDDSQRRLRDSLFSAAVPTAIPAAPRAPAAVPAAAETTSAGGGVTVTIPLQIEVRLGSAATAPVAVAVPGAGSAAAPAAPGPLAVTEAITIDPEYGNREGYDPEFLGSGALRVPLPKLSEQLQAEAARLRAPEPGAHPFELKYHHFSLVQHRSRRFAIVTAVNIDGRTAQSIRRETDKWFFDPRIDRDAQAGDEFYTANEFDRGHLVRRLDPAWGRTERIAKVANDDTFHFTNCTLQHAKFNEGKNLWAGLEDFLLNRAADDRKRLTVFTGPIYAKDDPDYRGVKVPRQYWKVAVIARPNGKLAALGFLVSQEKLLTPDVLKEKAVDVARTFQVPVSRVEELTGLNFGSLRTMDGSSVAGFGREAATARALESLDDIVLPPAPAAPEGGAAESFAVGGAAPAAAAPAPTGPTEEVPGTGLGYYLLAFDSDLQERTPEVTRRAVEALAREPVTDVFLFSHGWRGDVPAAREQYTGWIQAMAGVRADIDRAGRVRPGFRPLLVGLHWPSEPWGDENLGGPVSFAPGAAPSASVAAALVDEYARRIGDRPAIREPLRTIVAAAETGAEPDQLPPEVEEAYRALDRALGLGAGGVAADPGSDRERFDPEAVYGEFLADAGPASFGVGLPGRNALLTPLRVLSFWTMKDRACRFGENAAHPLLRRLLEAAGGRDVRFHLMGHSFGCIVVSATVAGAPSAPRLPRPVDSVALVQGAFSLWSFCNDIPFSRGIPGYFHRVVRDGCVRGPIVTTQSRFDTAVGTWYPRAAWAGSQVAFAPGELPKYGSVGTFGVQGPGISMVNELMRPAEGAYSFQPGRVYNLEASPFINEGGGFSGAHSDIRKAAVAHAVWSAALT
jgi:DNA/RNA endonuclease G (NUC1)/V8-like Glu-specific endopeptidase